MIESRVRTTLSLVLEQTFAATDPINRESIEAWDSLKHIGLVFALEDEFAFQIGEDELDEMVNVASITALVERHLA